MKYPRKYILDTTRLVLREMEMIDAPFFFKLNENPNVTRYTGDAAFKNIQEAEAITKYVIEQYNQFGYGRWMVLEKQTNKPMGWCGLKYHPEENFVDLGYRFLEEYWGNGYASEAAQACLYYGFTKLNLERVVGRVSKDNIASVKILQKLNMQPTQNKLFASESCDLVFEINKENYIKL